MGWHGTPDLGAVFQEGDVEMAGNVGSSGDLVGPGAVAVQLAGAGLKDDLLRGAQAHAHDECSLDLHGTLRAMTWHASLQSGLNVDLDGVAAQFANTSLLRGAQPGTHVKHSLTSTAHCVVPGVAPLQSRRVRLASTSLLGSDAQSHVKNAACCPSAQHTMWQQEACHCRVDSPVDDIWKVFAVFRWNEGGFEPPTP